MLVVLSEASFRGPSTPNSRELRSITDTAQLFGCRVYQLPFELTEDISVQDVFARVPMFEPAVAGIWVGYMPTLAYYTSVYEVAKQHGILLVNSPEEHKTIMEFDQYYPLLNGLTPESRVATSLVDCIEAANEMGYPLFLKGALKSNKEQGWSACVVNTEDELLKVAKQLFDYETLSRGKIILRRLVRIKSIGSDYKEFPIGYEYRVFLYRGTVLAYGFYWDDETKIASLSAGDIQAMLKLAVSAATRVGSPFMTVDIAQLETGEWAVIEVGDGQFSGLSQVPVLELFGKLAVMNLMLQEDKG
jgi:hypothetical protein